MDEQEKKELKEKALEGAAFETVQRFGSAASEHFKAYAGFDAETGEPMIKGLKKIAESRINPANREANINQQAGFSAEVKAAARENAEHIIKGDGHRTTRTDDLSKTIDSEGREIGGVNDELFDLVDVDSNGNIIEVTARQLKFVGKNPDECLDRLLSGKYDKYRDKDVPIEIPKEFYDEVKSKLNKQEDELKKQIKLADKNGKTDLVKSKQKQLERVQKTKNNLRKSNVSKKEAREARLHPKISTTKDVVKGAAIGGSVAAIKNVVTCIKGDISPEQAAFNVAKDTGTAAVSSYAMAFTGTVIKGAMQNSASAYVRGLARTNLETGLVLTTKNVAVITSRYFKGELSKAEYASELTKEGVGELGAAMGSTVFSNLMITSSGTAVKIASCIAGSTLGYMAAIAVYKEVSRSIKEYNMAVEQRKLVEAECEEIVALIREYRAEMEENVEQYMSEHLDVINNGFMAMDKAIVDDDPDGFVSGNAVIQKLLGHKIQFCNQNEFDDLMLSDEDFVL